jgi:hypothetical protein
MTRHEALACRSRRALCSSAALFRRRQPGALSPMSGSPPTSMRPQADARPWREPPTLCKFAADRVRCQTQQACGDPAQSSPRSAPNTRLRLLWARALRNRASIAASTPALMQEGFSTRTASSTHTWPPASPPAPGGAFSSYEPPPLFRSCTGAERDGLTG